MRKKNLNCANILYTISVLDPLIGAGVHATVD